MVSLYTMLTTEPSFMAFVPTILLIVSGVILLIALIIGMVKGIRKISWSPLAWLAAAAIFFLLDKLIFAKENPLSAPLAQVVAGMQLFPADKVDATAAFLSSLLFALGSIAVVLIIYGICTLAFRPKTKKQKRDNDEETMDEEGVVYDAEEADYDDYEDYEDSQITVKKGHGKPSVFGRILGGLVCVINTAMVIACVLSALLLLVGVTSLKDGLFAEFYAEPMVAMVMPYITDYALDAMFIGIIMGFAKNGPKKGFLESLRSLIVGLGSLVLIGFAFYLPFSPLALPQAEDGVPIVYEYVSRCIGVGRSLFTGSLAMIADVAGQILAGLILMIAIILIMCLINWALKKLVDAVDSVGFLYGVDCVLATIVYGVIGVVVAVILWAFWYVLSYYGIFNATALFGETASLSNGVFNTLQTLVKPYLDMLPDLLAGIGGGVPA